MIAFTFNVDVKVHTRTHTIFIDYSYDIFIYATLRPRYNRRIETNAINETNDTNDDERNERCDERLR